MQNDSEKLLHNAKSAEEMHRFLRQKSWEEKIRSIERMRMATTSAREAMRTRMQSQNTPKAEA